MADRAFPSAAPMVVDKLRAPSAAPVAVPRWRRRVLGLVALALRIMAALAAVSFGRAMLADQYEVPTSSMWPTIAPGDRIVVDKTAYGLRLPLADARVFARSAPAAGDVILFSDPRGGTVPLVKRVVAVAGQRVAMRSGVLYIDGFAQPIEEMRDGRTVEHLGAKAHEEGSRDFEDFGPIAVAPNHLFVMGDNRAASLDSRFLGAVPIGSVRGRVVGISYNYDGAHVSRLLRPLDRAAAAQE